MKESVLSLKEKKQHNVSNCQQVLEIFYDWPINHDFWRFLYMITRLQDWVQLSLYSTKALMHKYFVAEKYRWICCLFFSKSQL